LAAPDQPDYWYHILIFCVDHKLLVALSGNQNASEASADADEGENLIVTCKSHTT
jgi:hypothetical protein